MDILFRTMKEEDTEQVLSLFSKLQLESAGVSFTEIIDKVEFEAKKNEKGCFFYVAVKDYQIISVFRGRQGEGNKSHSALLTIAVDPNYRGKHLAKNFTEYCLTDLKNYGVSIARAYVYSDNKPSINALLSAGFTISGCVHQHHKNEKTGDFVDDVIFHKVL